MKKYALLFAACVLAVHSAFGQSGFEKGTLVMQAGIGYGLVGTEGDVVIPPVSFCMEYGSSENWSIGGYAGYASSRFVVASAANSYGLLSKDSGLEFTYLLFGGRLSYHLTENENVDTYAGVMLGYNAVSVTQFGPVKGLQALAGKNSALLYGGHLGVRYFLAPGFGVFAEAGYGIGYLTVGFSFKSQSKKETVQHKAERTIWGKWDGNFGNPEPEPEEPLLQAKILDMKNNYLIIDLGQSNGLKTGMDLKFYPSCDGRSTGKFYGTAVVTEARHRFAIIKISNSQLTAAVAVGDKLAVTVLPQTADY